MLPHQIATADVLDILFEGRNKLYGAYELRRGYEKRLNIALLVTVSLVTLFATMFFLNDRNYIQNTAKANRPDTLTITQIQKPEEDIPPPPPPPPPPPAPKIATVAFTTPPRIIKDEDVAPEDQPPAMDDMENKRIGSITQDGIDNPDITAPPINDKHGVIAAPVQRDIDNVSFVPVEIESEYPGGPNAWRRYLIKNLKYPEPAHEQGIQGAVTVKFIVDTFGLISNVEAIAGPLELRDEAVRVITKSGKWTPAIQNGRKVKTYKVQAIVFRLDSE